MSKKAAITLAIFAFGFGLFAGRTIEWYKEKQENDSWKAFLKAHSYEASCKP